MRMRISKTHIRKALWIVLLVAAMLVFGCACIEPYEPRDNREEGPEKGLFSGSEGEFVIFRKADELKSDDQADKGSDETSDDPESKNGEGEKGKDQER
jgi:hypothetical protein